MARIKLTALAPHWVGVHNWAASSPPFYIGVSFLCPHCDPSLPEHGPNRRRRLAFEFWPPIDPAGLQAKFGPGWWPRRGQHHTRVSGETFDTLTIEPSVGFESIGHWHGNIVNGECIT